VEAALQGNVLAADESFLNENNIALVFARVVADILLAPGNLGWRVRGCR
jgi:hypothetical protein